jgi:hypothetical protein
LIDGIAHSRFFGIAPFIFGDAPNRCCNGEQHDAASELQPILHRLLVLGRAIFVIKRGKIWFDRVVFRGNSLGGFMLVDEIKRVCVQQSNHPKASEKDSVLPG